MRLVEIMRVANKAYEGKDKILSLRGFFNSRTGRPNYGAEGDGLARFICIELSETYDSEASDSFQLETAAVAMGTVTLQCESISAALHAESDKPRPTVLDKLAAIPLRAKPRAEKKRRLKRGE